MQTPGPPFLPDEVGKAVKARIIFVRHGATMSSEDNLLMGSRDEELTTLGEMQANKAAELIMDLKVGSFCEIQKNKRNRCYNGLPDLGAFQGCFAAHVHLFQHQSSISKASAASSNVRIWMRKCIIHLDQMVCC